LEKNSHFSSFSPSRFLASPKKKIPKVAVIALGYISVGVAGYAAFPTTVGGNVLNSFSEGDGLMQAVRGVVGERKTSPPPPLFFFVSRFAGSFFLPPLSLCRVRSLSSQRRL
jgi:amino acid permease